MFVYIAFLRWKVYSTLYEFEDSKSDVDSLFYTKIVIERGECSFDEDDQNSIHG